MSELKMWMRVLFWTQLALTATLVSTLATNIAEGDVIYATLNSVCITVVALTALVARKRYREIR